MAQEKAASEALRVALTQFRQAKTLLSNSLKTASTNKRIITSKMSPLSDALSEISRCHTLSIAKSGITEEDLSSDEFSTSWLESLRNEVDYFQLQVKEMLLEIKSAQTLKEDPQVHMLMEQLDSMKLDIASKLDKLLITLEPSNKKVVLLLRYTVISSLRNDISETLKQLMLLDLDNMKRHCNELGHFKRVI